MISFILKKENQILLFIFLAGFFVRFFSIGKNDLWFDEAAYIGIAIAYTMPPFVFFNRPFGPLNPPLSYLFGKMWGIFIYRFGWTEGIFRFPCALASATSLILIYFLAKKMFNKKIAILSVGLMALSPFQIWYAQDISNYAVATLAGLLSSFFLYSFLKNKTTESLVLYIFSAAMLLYGYYLGLLLYACQVFIAIETDKIDLRKKLCVFLPIFMFLPVFPLFLNSYNLIKGGFWVPKPNLMSVLYTFENFVLGYNGTNILYFLTDVLLAFIVFCVIRQYIRKTQAPEKQEVAICIFLFFLPIAIAYVFSLFSTSIYLDRAFLIFSPYFYILAAWALESIRHRVLKILTLSMVLVILVLSLVRYFSNQLYEPANMAHHQGVYIKKPYKPLSEYLLKNIKERDFIAFGNEHSIPPLCYYRVYHSPFARLYPDLVKFSSFIFFAVDPDLTNPNWRRPAEEFYGPSAWLITKDNLIGYLKNRKAQRVFFLGHDSPRSGRLDQNSQSIKTFFNERLHLIDILDFDGIKLFIYDCQPLYLKSADLKTKT